MNSFFDYNITSIVPLESAANSENISIEIKYNYWFPDDGPARSISYAPKDICSSSKVMLIGSELFESLKDEEQKKILITRLVAPYVGEEVENMLRRIQKQTIRQLNSVDSSTGSVQFWASQESKEKAILKLPSYLNGAFVIVPEKKSCFTIITNNPKDKKVTIKVESDGSLVDPKGRLFPNLLHMLAFFEYNHLKFPVPDKGIAIKDSYAFMDSVWEIILDEVKMNSEERTLATDLRRIVSIYGTSTTLDPEERERIIAKLGIKKIDLKTVLDLVQPFPFRIRKILLQDFMFSFIKSFGHDWGIQAILNMNDFSFTANSLKADISHTKLAKSVKEFFGLPLRDGSVLTQLDPILREELVNKITTSLDSSIAYSTHDDKTQEVIAKALSDYNEKKPITIGTGWFRHGVELTFYNGFMVYTNRGKRLQLGRWVPPDQKIFKIGEGFNLTPSLLGKIMLSQENYSSHLEEERMKWLETGEGLHKELGIDFNQPFGEIKKSDQKAGICSWANCKGGFLAELVLLLLEVQLKAGDPEFIALHEASRAGVQIFKEWEYTSRSHWLDEFLKLDEFLGDSVLQLGKIEYFKFIQHLADKAGNKMRKYSSKERSNTLTQRIREEIYAKTIGKLECFDCSIEDFIHSPNSNLTTLQKSQGAFSLTRNEEEGWFVRNPGGLKLQVNIYGKIRDYQLIPNSNGDGYLYEGKMIRTSKELQKVFYPDLRFPI